MKRIPCYSAFCCSNGHSGQSACSLFWLMALEALVPDCLVLLLLGMWQGLPSHQGVYGRTKPSPHVPKDKEWWRVVWRKMVGRGFSVAWLLALKAWENHQAGRERVPCMGVQAEARITCRPKAYVHVEAKGQYLMLFSVVPHLIFGECVRTCIHACVCVHLTITLLNMEVVSCLGCSLKCCKSTRKCRHVLKSLDFFSTFGQIFLFFTSE